MRHNDPAGPTFSRRALVEGAIAGAAAGSLAFSAGPASAQRCGLPSRVKGPAVWLDMDQQELDDAYDQSVYAFNQRNIAERSREGDASALARIGSPERIAYGSAYVERILFYRAKNALAPILIFLHGGAWQSGNVTVTDAGMAEVYVKAGAHFASVEFDGVNKNGGNLPPLVEQCRRAVGWIYKNADSIGVDRSRIYLCGHSSGGHLGGCVLITDWAREGLPANPFKGAILGSGMYDLKPVRLSKRSAFVKITDDVEQALSPQRHLEKIVTPLVLTYGTLETPEFQRQTRDFAAALTAAGKPIRLLEGKGYNHFETQETIRNPYGFMGRAALEMMGLPV